MKKISKFFGFFTLSFIWLLPIFAMAQVLPFTETKGLFGVLNTISRLLNLLIPILITLGVIYFIWGVIKYVTAKDEDAQKEARSVMIYGIIGLFVIVSIWGLVNLLAQTFGVTPGKGPGGVIPCVPGTPGCI